MDKVMNHNKDGKLIVFEGISASGKGSQIELLKIKLESLGYDVIVTSWNSDDYINPLIGEMKRDKAFTPITWSILHATDFARRYKEIIVPALNQGKIVLADRYYYTAYTRDTIRGIDLSYLRGLYSFARVPNITIYLDIDTNVALERRLKRYSRLGYYSSGCDIYNKGNITENWIEYNETIRNEYRKLWNDNDVVEISGMDSEKIISEKVFKSIEILL